jgi:alkylhydroperoxidase family enzyme
MSVRESRVVVQVEPMSWIKTVGADEARGALRREYETGVRRAGRVFEILKIQSLNPEALRASMALYVALMKGPSPLSRAVREMLGVVVSRTNGCHY